MKKFFALIPALDLKARKQCNKGRRGKNSALFWGAREKNYGTSAPFAKKTKFSASHGRGVRPHNLRLRYPWQPQGGMLYRCLENSLGSRIGVESSSIQMPTNGLE